MMSGLESGLKLEECDGARRNAARQASSRESGRCQPAKETPGQTAAVVENDARCDGLAIAKHSKTKARELSKRDKRSRPRQTQQKSAALSPRFFLKSDAGENYSPTAAARSCFSTMRA